MLHCSLQNHVGDRSCEMFVTVVVNALHCSLQDHVGDRSCEMFVTVVVMCVCYRIMWVTAVVRCL